MTDEPNVLTIFGAGMAGLIAARMLSDRLPVVVERQPSLPNNHHAVLRFRSSIVGDAVNIPFKKVNVIKHVISEPGSNPIRDAALYSRKVTGLLHARSILDVKPVERYIAPPDFISRLSKTAEIYFGVDFQEWSHNLVRPHGPVISTIPVPVMMDLFKWKDKPEFRTQSGWVIKAAVKPELDCQIYATIYCAIRDWSWYRASLTGSELMIEGTGDDLKDQPSYTILRGVLDRLGMSMNDVSDWEVKEAKYQKIADLSTPERESVKRFVMYLSNEHRIYSLGRFATWRPKLLLDDIVNDVRVIARLIDGESLYNENLNKEA